VEDTTLAVEVAADRMHPAVTAEATAANRLPVIECQNGWLRPPVFFG
jgi:hypothetical protein